MKKTALAFTLAAVTSVVACESHDHDEVAPNLTVTISGEGGALTGFAFPPTSSRDLAFVDGWDVKFERILVTVDDIVLSDNPDLSPTDQSLTGTVVATAKGPWAVDMTKPGAVTDIKPRTQSQPLSDGDDHVDGHGHGHGLEKNPDAQLLARFDALDGNKSFDPVRRYAFGFDIVTASANAQITNLDATAQADYAEMTAKGLSVLYVGTATFKGVDCKSSDASYDFGKLPTTVKFRFGFKTPTKYKNCQNSDLRGKAFDGEESQRGVQVSDPTTAQIALHVDHPFWSTVDHDAAELFFDQMAAVASPDGTLVIDDLASVDFTSFKDREGNALPWRSCMADRPVKSGQRRFDPGSVAVDPSGAPEMALRNYADYVSYQQSTQGHLNAAGLCAVERKFAAPR